MLFSAGFYAGLRKPSPQATLRCRFAGATWRCQAMAGVFRGWYNIKARVAPVGQQAAVRILVRLVGLLCAKYRYLTCG